MAILTGIRVYRDENGVQQQETYTYEKDDALIAKEQRQGEINDRMSEILGELQQTDFKAIKFAEGAYTETEFAPTKLARENLRAEYNELEKELAGL